MSKHVMRTPFLSDAVVTRRFERLVAPLVDDRLREYDRRLPEVYLLPLDGAR